ncbi:hypothetical protein FNO01nite_33820 [Flavobacterium noncentrifugens]|uniref:Uncharacterized protein n=1 Tax=Flavobacterium noncentrifugens TaxID=1128970 RepID=A0A1G9DL02_9FLAO|nr:hypothetical protein [Flavobacterium noncentrifugens]GEP52710.1 hypothetical protein FNO01nite_33820 [Flavobacterium noncentrifugens]SDK64567.1 hypothetical protein SAMN04487935_3843 [Flavobacterium noncentrifugens]SDK64899.1 hypothetical protein SAMN04487935_3849 [Flavobacterium noncentrifugens]
MNSSQSEHLQKLVAEINSVKKDKAEKLVQLIKHITTISFGMLTVLVAFKPENSNCFQEILFSVILSAIGASIISGIIYMYSIVDELNEYLKIHLRHFDIRLSGDYDSYLRGEIPKKWYFNFSKVFFYLSSLIVVILLVTYGIIS